MTVNMLKMSGDVYLDAGLADVSSRVDTLLLQPGCHFMYVTFLICTYTSKSFLNEQGIICHFY